MVSLTKMCLTQDLNNAFDISVDYLSERIGMHSTTSPLFLTKRAEVRSNAGAVI